MDGLPLSLPYKSFTKSSMCVLFRKFSLRFIILFTLLYFTINIRKAQTFVWLFDRLTTGCAGGHYYVFWCNLRTKVIVLGYFAIKLFC